MGPSFDVATCRKMFAEYVDPNKTPALEKGNKGNQESSGDQKM